VGAQKAGTSSLVKNLNKHADIFVADEVHFFDMYFDFGVDWYLNKYVHECSRSLRGSM
jgi:hypothetical protein